jgi:hypothetical protein
MQPFVNLPAIAKSELTPAKKLTPVTQTHATLEFVSFSHRVVSGSRARAAYARTMRLASQNGPQALNIYF